MSTKVLGAYGENYAKKMLIKNGYEVIKCNFTCKVGEIDIIALDKDILVFVEVKTRNSTKFGLPEEAVTERKILKISRVGEWYARLYPNLPKKRRIDVVSLLLDGTRVIREKIIRGI